MKRYLPVLLRIVIGGVFIWAGAVKAWDPSAFADTIEGYRLIPHAWAVAVALYLPWLEIVCGVAMIVGRFKDGATLILATLLLIFLAALTSAWWRGLDINCGCFSGATQSTDYVWPVSRDVLLLAALMILFRLMSRRSKIELKQKPE